MKKSLLLTLCIASLSVFTQNVQQTDMQQALVKALIQRNLAQVKYAFDNGANMIDAIYYCNCVNVDKADTIMLKYLLEKGANPNVRDIGDKVLGWTPLIRAIMFTKPEKDNIAVIKLLIEHGANVNMESLDGNSPFDEAKLYKNKAAKKILKAHSAKKGSATKNLSTEMWGSLANGVSQGINNYSTGTTGNTSITNAYQSANVNSANTNTSNSASNSTVKSFSGTQGYQSGMDCAYIYIYIYRS